MTVYLWGAPAILSSIIVTPLITSANVGLLGVLLYPNSIRGMNYYPTKILSRTTGLNSPSLSIVPIPHCSLTFYWCKGELSREFLWDFEWLYHTLVRNDPEIFPTNSCLPLPWKNELFVKILRQRWQGIFLCAEEDELTIHNIFIILDR